MMYLTIISTDKARISKKIGGRNLGQHQVVLGFLRVFCHFLKFGSLVFLEMAYIDSLQQCVTSSRGKIHKKKNWGPNLNVYFISFP